MIKTKILFIFIACIAVALCALHNYSDELFKEQLIECIHRNFRNESIFDEEYCGAVPPVNYLPTVRTTKCLLRDLGDEKKVCVCNKNHCDFIPPVKKILPTHYLTYTSNMAGLRFKKVMGRFERRYRISDTTIEINRAVKRQRIHGFGGAFSDSTGINLLSLDKETREYLLQSYFSENGIGYNLCRIPIGGTDYSTRGYSYHDESVDIELKSFKLAPEDYKYKLPFMRKARFLSGNKMQFIASTWSPPKWMKTNGDYGGIGFLKANMYQPYADYHVKFLDEYKKEGVSFWGITTGNEPSSIYSFNRIPKVGWLPHQVRDWIGQNFGPTLRKSQHFSIKIMAIDDQRFSIPWVLDLLCKNNETNNYIDGISIHWYFDEVIPPTVLTRTHEKYPEKFILYTEACKGHKFYYKHVDLGSWIRGEDYVFNIIENLQHWVTGWLDWNMALNLVGGPSYVHGYSDSPIIVNASSGEFYKQPMFYALGHFAKFLSRNSIYISSNQSNEHVFSVAFERPDNGTVVVILNRNKVNVPISVSDEDRGVVNINLTANSFTTLIYW